MSGPPPTTSVRPAPYKDAGTQTPTRTPIYAAASTRIPAWKRGSQPPVNPAKYSNYMALQQGRSLLAGIDLDSPSPSPSTYATSSLAPAKSAARANFTPFSVIVSNVASGSVGKPNVTRNIVNTSSVTSNSVSTPNVTPNIANTSNITMPTVTFAALPAPSPVTLNMRVHFQRQPDSFTLGVAQILVGIAQSRPPPAGDIYAQLMMDIWQKSNELGQPSNYHCRNISIRWERDSDTPANIWLQDREIGDSGALERVIRVIHSRQRDGVMGDVLVAWFGVE